METVTKEAEILLTNVSETVNNSFDHDSTEVYIKILFLGRSFRLGCLLIRFIFQIAKKHPADCYLCDHTDRGAKAVKTPLRVCFECFQKDNDPFIPEAEIFRRVLRSQLNKIIL